MFDRLSIYGIDPVMSAADSVQARLFTLADALRQIQQLISRLAKTSSSSSHNSHADHVEGRLELADEIHSALKEQEEDFELLQQDFSYHRDRAESASRGLVEKDSGEVELATRIAKHAEDLKIARFQFRKAQLTAKRNAEAAQTRDRNLLFAQLQEDQSSSAQNHGRRKAQEKLSQDEIALNTSSDLTASIRQLHGLMTAELERSQFARETLGKCKLSASDKPGFADCHMAENSTKDLSSLTESYNNLDNLLSSSRSLVSTLISSQKSDTWYLESAFFILVCTIGWLAFRRIFYGPLWYIVYLPLKLLIRLASPVVSVFLRTSNASARTSGGRGQSHSLRSASGKSQIPTFRPGMPEQAVKVGAGGQGAKAEQHTEESNHMTESVGKIIEASQGSNIDPKPQETVLRERRPDERPNPKKRMMEGPPQDQGEAVQSKDEL